MKHPKQTGHIAVALAIVFALALFGGPAAGQDPTASGAETPPPDIRRWTCADCPFTYGLIGDILIGAQVVSDDFFEFGNYRGLEEDGVFGDFSADLLFRTEKADYLEFHARDLGIDSRELSAAGGRQGVYKAYLTYDEIPYFRADDTRTIFLGAGTANQTLPPDWLRADTTDQFSALPAALRPVDIEHERETLGLGFAYQLPEHWHYRVDYQRTVKEGNRIQGGAFIFRATELAAPVDYETHRVDLGIGYRRDFWEIETAYHLSIFDNDNNMLRFENPFTGINGAARGELAQEPDNEFHQITLSGSWRRSRWLTVVGQLSLGFNNQDQAFLAPTLNPNLLNPALPAADLNGEVKTRAARLRLTSSPLDRLTARVQFAYDERDNDSPQHSFLQVVTDTFVTEERVNEPFSYERFSIDATLDYRLFSFLKLNGGFKHQETDRIFQEVDDTDTQTYRAGLSATPFSRLSLNVDVKRENRDNDLDPALLGPQENPGLRRFHFAEQERDSLRAALDYAILDNLFAGLYAEIADEDFTDTEIGVSEARDESYGFDLSATFGRDISAHAFVAKESLKSVIRGADNITGFPWVATTDDNFHTVGFGVNFADLPGKWVRAAIDFSYAAADGEVRTDKAGNAPPFPELETNRFTLETSVERELRKNINLYFAYLVGRLTEDDFFRDGVDPATVPTLLSLGEGTPDKTVHVVRVGLRYTFE